MGCMTWLGAHHALGQSNGLSATPGVRSPVERRWPGRNRQGKADVPLTHAHVADLDILDQASTTSHWPGTGQRGRGKRPGRGCNRPWAGTPTPI